MYVYEVASYYFSHMYVEPSRTRNLTLGWPQFYQRCSLNSHSLRVLSAPATSSPKRATLLEPHQYFNYRSIIPITACYISHNVMNCMLQSRIKKNYCLNSLGKVIQTKQMIKYCVIRKSVLKTWIQRNLTKGELFSITIKV